MPAGGLDRADKWQGPARSGPELDIAAFMPPQSLSGGETRMTRSRPPGLLEAPPGLSSCGPRGLQDSGSAPPSPHTPVPPAVWNSDGGLEGEHLPAGAQTPPRGKSPAFSVPVHLRPPHGQRHVLGHVLGQPQQAPPSSGADVMEKARAKAVGHAALAPTIVMPVPSGSWPEPPRETREVREGREGRELRTTLPKLSARPGQREERTLASGAGTASAETPPQEELPATHLSLGSIGHPHSCSSACRYVKRKGGCRDGVRCTHCHLCFWRRDRDNAQDSSDAPVQGAADPDVSVGAAKEGMSTLISQGTQGHPHSCAGACRYVRRKMGCRNGAACPNCHACLWTRELQSSSTGVGQNASPGFFGDSTQTLQGLIRLFMRSQDAEGDEEGQEGRDAQGQQGSEREDGEGEVPPASPTFCAREVSSARPEAGSQELEEITQRLAASSVSGSSRSGSATLPASLQQGCQPGHWQWQGLRSEEAGEARPDLKDAAVQVGD